MTKVPNIVERLRAVELTDPETFESDGRDLVLEAADEIERLTAELAAERDDRCGACKCYRRLKEQDRARASSPSHEGAE